MADTDCTMIGGFAAAFGRHARAAKARQEAAETQTEADRARKHADIWADVCTGLLELQNEIVKEANTSKDAA